MFFSTRDLTFLKKTSPQVATTLRRISHDTDPDPGSTHPTKDPKNLLQLHLFPPEVLLKILYLIKIGVGTYSSIPMRQSHSIMLPIQLLVGSFPLSMRLTRNRLNHHNQHHRHLLTPDTVFIDLPTQSSMISLPWYLDISFYETRLHLTKLCEVDRLTAWI
jgi:hypothetical protein